MRVTLKQIAAQTGFHHSTVSRALRGDRALPETTRQLIQAKARQLGYRPDPYLSGLIAHRAARGAKRFRAVLAWVNNWPQRQAWRRWTVLRQLFLGAQRRAEALGYRLDEYWYAAPGLSPARAAQVLQTRRIQGLIFGPQPEPLTLAGFDFSSFAAVTLGQTLRAPALHSVTSDHYQNACRLLRSLREQGFTRIGYVTTPAAEARTNGQWQAGFHWAATQGREEQLLIPPCYLPDQDDSVALSEWLTRHRPEVIATPSPHRVLRRLREGGRRVPEDISLASAAMNDDVRFFAGITEHPEVVGAAAVDCVVELLHKDERGVPEVPRRLTIAGSWADGPSVRAPRFRPHQVVA